MVFFNLSYRQAYQIQAAPEEWSPKDATRSLAGSDVTDPRQKSYCWEPE